MHFVHVWQLWERSIVAVISSAALNVELATGGPLPMTRFDVRVAEDRQFVGGSSAAARNTIHAVLVPRATLPALNGVLAVVRVSGYIVAIRWFAGVAFKSEGMRFNGIRMG